jgi:SOS-response transcriptional repressor LexA
MFKKIFIKLCAERGESPSSVCKKIGISAAAFSQWDDNTIPRKVTQERAADYFGVSVDYLLGNEDAPIRSAELTQLDGSDVHMLPLYESVSAGFGALAVNEVVDYIPSHFKSPAEAAESLCIKVKGNSMSPKIEDGDIIQVHKQDSIDSGSLAVVLVDGEEGFVKIVTYGDTWIELRSINPLVKPRRFNGSDVQKVRVVGIVTKIIKSVTGNEETVYPPSPATPAQKELLDLISGLDADQIAELQNYVDFLKSKRK